MKIFNIIVKVIFSLILVLPILGVTGIFPPATRDLYNTDQAFSFIQILTSAYYIMYMMTVVHVIALFCLWTKREALAAILVLPITLNVVGFHLVLDGGLLTGGASLGNVMLLCNLYLMYKNRLVYKSLLTPTS
jgi:hypothetical protein